MHQPVRGLVLDLDDTLIDTKRAMYDAGVVAAGLCWPEATGEEVAAFAARQVEDPLDFYEEYAAGRRSFDDMRAARVEEVCRHVGLPADEELIARFEREYWVALGAVQTTFADVQAFLDAAEARAIPMVLVTNSSQSHADMKIDAVGLRQRFVEIISTDTLGIGKPDPRVFELAVRQLGVEPSQVLSVGDHVGRDVLAAIDAGLQAVWLRRDGDDQPEPVPAVPAVSSLHAVTTMF